MTAFLPPVPAPDALPSTPTPTPFRSLRIYVAGSSQEMARASRAMRALRAAGHVVVGDWVTAITSRGLGGTPNRGLPSSSRMRAQDDCFQAIDQAEVFWLLAPETRSAGCWVELGYAHVADWLLSVVCTGDTDQSIFCEPWSCYQDDGEGLAHIARLAASLAGGAA